MPHRVLTEQPPHVSEEDRESIVRQINRLVRRLVRIRDESAPPSGDKAFPMDWTDEDYLYIEALVADGPACEIDISVQSQRVFFRVRR
jgi:hypothetical protein